MKNCLLLILLSCSTLALTVIPGKAQEATLNGRVLNGSRDSSVVANQPVTLQLFRAAAHAPVDVATQRSSANGAYSFAVAAPDTGATYIASTEHDGVRYYSDQAHFAHMPQARTDIVIFDSTQSNREIAVLMHHLFIQDSGESLSLRETRVLSNPTQKTILNAIADGHEHGAILRIDLPPWAMNITPIPGQFGTDLHVHENALYDAGVFEPGSRQLSFAYELPWQRNRATLVIQVYQPTRSLDLFIGEQGLKLEGAGLVAHGPFNIRGTAYQRFGLENVAAGTRLQLQVVRETPQAEAFPSWLIPIATAALLLFGVSFSRLFKPKPRGGISSMEREKLTKERASLIDAIARLELQPGYTTDPNMQEDRADRFDRLQAVERNLHAQVKTSGSKAKSAKK